LIRKWNRGTGLAACGKFSEQKNPLDGGLVLQVMEKQYFGCASVAHIDNQQENMKISSRCAANYVFSALLVVDVVVVVRVPIGAP